MAQLPLIGSTATVFSFPFCRIRTWAQRSAGKPLAKAAGQSTLQHTKSVRGSRAIATSSGLPWCAGNPVNSSTSRRGNDDEVTGPSEILYPLEESDAFFAIPGAYQSLIRARGKPKRARCFIRPDIAMSQCDANLHHSQSNRRQGEE